MARTRPAQPRSDGAWRARTIVPAPPCECARTYHRLVAHGRRNGGSGHRAVSDLPLPVARRRRGLGDVLLVERHHERVLGAEPMADGGGSVAAETADRVLRK